MSNFRRYASYEGYQMTTKLKDPASLDAVSRMDFVAIDATKFTKYGGAESLSEEDQFKMKNVIRDLNKALVGFNFPEEFRHKIISTGKWGCGAFGGDPQLKFLIQWMATSLLRRPMIFHTF